MRLVSYGAMGSERAGMLVDDAIIDLPVSDMRLFLEQPDWRRQLDRIFAARSSAKAIERKSVRLGAPVPVPRKLLTAAANTKSHPAEAGPVLKAVAPPRSPMILAKATSSLCGPFDDVIHPRETRKLDYELELGVVIGKRCRRIGEAEVKDHLAGYMVRSEEHTSELQSRLHLVCRLLLEKKKTNTNKV